MKTMNLCGLSAALVVLPACVQQHTTTVVVPPPAAVIAAPAALTPAAAPQKKKSVQPAVKAPEALPPLHGTHSQVISPGDGVKAKRSMGGEKTYAH